MVSPSDSVAGAGTPGAGDDIDYRRVFDLSLDLVCVAGLDGYFKRVNPSWTRVMGWTEAELLARPVAEFMHPDDRDRTLAARAALAKGVPVRGLENRYLCKDGSFRWLAWQSSVEMGSQRVYAVARDITERRRQDMEQLVFSKLECTGMFAAGIAHDFNNLLAAMLLNVDMIPVCGALTQEQRAYLRRARDAVHSANALTQQLITFARGDSSDRQIIDLNSLVPQAVDIALLGSRVRRELSLPATLHRVEVDEGQISHVISGLVMNAREATESDGSVRVEAENVVLSPIPGAAQSGDFVRIRVIDNGVGISAENLTKVFDPYFSTKERGARKGMGLGLAICRSIIQRHGGAISIESATGRGTIVTCDLPAARSGHD